VSSRVRSPGRAIATAVTEPFTRQSWAEVGYALAGLPLAPLGLLLSVVPVALCLPPFIVVGLPLLAASSAAVLLLGRVHRALAFRLLGLAVGEVAPLRPGRGFAGWMRSAVKDPAAWRARAYLVARFPVALASSAAVVVFRAGSLIFVASPAEWAAGLWTRQVVTGGVAHRYVVNFGRFYFDTWPRMALAVGIGVAGWWLSPWILRAVLLADKYLIANLLGPSPLSARVGELERSRTQAVEGAQARLRRIERDLHDGAQAGLVATAMKLGLAREKLAAASAADPADLTQASRLVVAAHEGIKDAITQLRDLARGVHPPVLDQGLNAALTTLAASSQVPVTLVGDLPDRPSPAIEATVYFCAAELLANVAKHAAATRASIELVPRGPRLRMRVSDDGSGGAHVSRDGGLHGLRTRLQDVDGTLDVASPPGGPTVVEIVIPLRA
jgi:signal transduction histidine kinase